MHALFQWATASTSSDDEAMLNVDLIQRCMENEVCIHVYKTIKLTNVGKTFVTFATSHKSFRYYVCNFLIRKLLSYFLVKPHKFSVHYENFLLYISLLFMHMACAYIHTCTCIHMYVYVHVY